MGALAVDDAPALGITKQVTMVPRDLNPALERDVTLRPFADFNRARPAQDIDPAAILRATLDSQRRIEIQGLINLLTLHRYHRRATGRTFQRLWIVGGNAQAVSTLTTGIGHRPLQVTSIHTKG